MVRLVIKYALLALLVVFLLACAYGFYRTWKMARSDEAEIFSRGTFPSPLPDGLYDGEAIGLEDVTWKGKAFDAAAKRGINVFYTDGKKSEKYPFVTSQGNGVRDALKQVLKIDYNLNANPLWVRTILDEIVQVAPGEYLGKVHLRIIPGVPFTMGYFRLKKAAAPTTGS